MTEQSSCKRSFFGKYLFYRIGMLKGNLFVCITLNLLGLPFFAVGHLHIASAQLNGTGVNREFFGYASFCGPACIFILLAMAVTGAAVSFVYYNKKEFTDTLGVLPLSHRERFWGDFLGGYIANVAPFIPCSLISIIMFAITQDEYRQIAERSGGEPVSGCMPFIIGLSLSLLFTYTFGYIISAIVTSICGRFMFAEIFSVVGTAVFAMVIMGTAGCFVNEITGIIGTDEINRANAYAMPIGLLFGEVREGLSGAGAFTDQRGGMEFFEDFMILKPLNIVIFTAAATALTVLAYYVSKSRKQERVGKIVVQSAAFRGLELLTAAAAVIISASLGGGLSGFRKYFIIGAAIGAVIVIVYEVIRRPRVKELPKTVLCYAGTLICCFGLCLLFEQTGAFGLRYIHTPPEDIEYVRVEALHVADGSGRSYSGVYKITDKSDIGQFTEKHNSVLSSYSNWLSDGQEYLVEYKLADGSTIKRGYVRQNYDSYKPLDEMIGNLCGLPGFPKAMCGFMTDGTEIERCSAGLNGMYGNIDLTGEELSEFCGIFSTEIIEGFSANAPECGTALFTLVEGENSNKTALIPIQKNYTKTIEFLKAHENADGEDDENKLALSVSYGNYNSNRLTLSIMIYKKDLNDPLVKELFSLLKQIDVSETEIPDGAAQYFSVTSTDTLMYYVPDSAKQRVMEIMLAIAEKAAE